MQDQTTLTPDGTSPGTTDPNVKVNLGAQPAAEPVDSTAHTSKRPLIFGEILFDTFEGGKRVLGGAAFNVAWNLKGFGLDPIMISGIGQDDSGNEILEKMTAWGMDTTGIQIKPDHDTGTVEVQVSDGQPSYTIKPDQAYDHIDASQVLNPITDNNISSLYHGSLALRGDKNKQTLQTVKAHLSSPVLLDLNLREPWWTPEIVEMCMGGTTWAKLNDEELMQITQSDAETATDLNQLGMDVLHQYTLSGLLVTRGSKGATWLSEDDGMVSVPAARVDRIVDTVGAGDAFCSVLMLGLLQRWNMPVCLERASRFASTVCGMQGATTDDPTLYNDQLRCWQEEDLSYE